VALHLRKQHRLAPELLRLIVKSMATQFNLTDFGLQNIGKLYFLNLICYLGRDHKYRPSIQTESESPIFTNQKLPIFGLPPHRCFIIWPERTRGIHPLVAASEQETEALRCPVQDASLMLQST
jgi:hypothetical protein